jgi:acyl carrier protein
MDKTAERLIKCFSLVFPSLPPDQIPSATADNVNGWDSVAQVNLLSLIGEEFSIDIDFEEFEGATSFGALLDHLREISSRA